MIAGFLIHFGILIMQILLGFLLLCDTGDALCRKLCIYVIVVGRCTFLNGPCRYLESRMIHYIENKSLWFVTFSDDFESLTKDAFI